eukprot:7861498-Alexandrium_andersonii.AAC.1
MSSWKKKYSNQADFKNLASDPTIGHIIASSKKHVSEFAHLKAGGASRAQSMKSSVAKESAKRSDVVEPKKQLRAAKEFKQEFGDHPSSKCSNGGT